jgi:hypothetical protein
LGGDLSRAQSTLLETAATTWLLVSSIDEWLKTQATIVSTRKKKALLPVVLQRQQLVDSLGRHLERLGLERRAKSYDLAAELAKLHQQSTVAAATAPETPRPARPSEETVCAEPEFPARHE